MTDDKLTTGAERTALRVFHDLQLAHARQDTDSTEFRAARPANRTARSGEGAFRTTGPGQKAG